MVSTLVSVHPDLLGGTPAFTGSRVPVRSLFDYLEANYTLDEFLECFPTVTREMALQVLDESERALVGVPAACESCLTRASPHLSRACCRPMRVEGDLEWHPSQACRI